MEVVKDSKDNKTLDEIVEQLRNKNIVFFIGAGLSLGSGLPSWEDLIEFLCKKNNIKFKKPNPHASDKGKYLQKKAQIVERKVASYGIVSLIKECFEEKKPSCGYAITMQRLLVTIAARTSGVIFTTNYDDLLEQAAITEGITPTIYAYPDLFSEALGEVLESNRLKNEGSLCIFKIHGTVNGEKVILSDTSYDEAYRNELISIQTRLSDINVFFLGCSFTDPYFGTEYRKGMGHGKWYTFYPLLPGKSIDNEIIESQNINVVKYEISNMSDNDQHNNNIKELFDYLSDKLDLKSPVNVGSQSDIERVQKNRAIKKIKLTKELGRKWCLGDLDAVEEVICCKEITRIPKRAFFNCSSLRIIRLEAGITSIGDEAFDGCANLEKIYFGNRENEFSSLEQLGKGAFRNCAALVSVKFSDACRIDSVPEGCFQGCQSLVQVYFPEGIKKISDNAFLDCKSLVDFKFRRYSNLSEIGKRAFQHCVSLHEADMSDSVMRIGGGAFQECMKLWVVRIPANLEKIEEYCFADCSALESLTNLEVSKVRSVGWRAFQRCLELRPSSFPESCEHVDPTAFLGCPFQKEWMELLHS